MDIEAAKQFLKTQVPPGAQKLVIAYAAQLAVASEIRAQAIKAGASEQTLNAVQTFVPVMTASFVL